MSTAIAEHHSEALASAVNRDGLLIVRTTVGRILTHPIEQIGVRLPDRESGDRDVDLDPSGKGLYIDGTPITLARLRKACGA